MEEGAVRRFIAAAAIAAGCAALIAIDVEAQAPAPAANTVDSVRQAARSDRRGLVERNMQLTAEEAKKFWPVYDAYQKDLERIIQRQNRALLDYVNSESSMTDANAQRIAKDFVAADVDEMKLRDGTLKKLSKVLPPKKAVRFLQIENKIRTLQRFDIAEQMPLVR
jgi:Spy/CpxP family protein refolding chaperone